MSMLKIERLSQRGAMQLVKDFTTECACDEMEFDIGTVTEEDQSFEGIIEHLHDAFQLRETLSELISDFYGQSQKPRRLRTLSSMTCRCWTEKSLHISHLFS